VFDLECDQFSSPKSAPEQQAKDGAIADGPATRTHRGTQEFPGLQLFEPVPCPNAVLLRTFDFADAGGKLGCQQPPLSAASAASFRMAARRTLIVEGARPCASR
jgi:hypothetical protein